MIPSTLYFPIYIYLIIIMTFISLRGMGNKSFYEINHGTRNDWVAFVLCLLLSLWIGQRPISDIIFGDTQVYAHYFDLMKYENIPPTLDDEEWLFSIFMFMCSKVMDVHTYFTIIDIMYFGFTFWACRRFTPNNVLISTLFCLGAFSFYSYGTNGIRNGLACSILLVALSYMDGNYKNKLKSLILAFLAVNIHNSTLLPFVMSLAALLFVKNFRYAFTFWILSIFISLVAGDSITSFFGGLGFDRRLDYLTTKPTEGVFSHTGFRWDFLIYSMMPICLGYYVVIKRGIENKIYTHLLNTYTLTNAFWVMVIQANYSNRFAYLSWFMYPIVLAYPLLKLNVWDEIQGLRLKQIMLAQVGFTWFMNTIY